MSEVKNIPDGWVKTEIGNLVDLAQGVAINAKTDYVLSDKENGIPLLKINNLLNNTVDQYANPDLVPKQSIIHKNDIIFTRTGQVGAVLFNKYGILHNNSFKVIPKDEIYWKYLYWYLKSERVYNYVQKVAAGSVQKDLNHSAFKTIEFTYPKNKDEQKSIAVILTTFDNKIELLKAQNKTLEEIAQTIFTEWFGKYKGDDELPDGWKIVKLGNELETYLGGTPSKTKSEFWLNGTIPWINSGKVNDFRILEPSQYITTIGLKKSATKLLPKGTVVIAITGATLGQYSMLEIDCCFNQSVVGIKENEKIHSSYIYFWVAENIGNIIRHATGGAQQHINKENINLTEFLLPPDNILEKFYAIADPVMSKISSNMLQIQTLTKTRDELLPRLMTSEIRVNEFKV